MNDEVDREVFGPLADIPQRSLITLAARIRERLFHTRSEKGQLLGRIVGSYNIVHIIQLDNDFRLVIRVPVTGWGSGKTETAARALESQVATMRLIAQKTSIPVPQVYDFDTTDRNEIQAPYMCISFVSGMPVSQAWFREPATMSRHELRLNILRSLSQVMAQFSCFSFDKIGSIPGDGAGSHSLAPCYSWGRSDDGTLRVMSSGPFDTTSAYLAHHYKEDVEDAYGKAALAVMKSVMPASVNYDSSGEFVLCPPDFDSQNVMVDQHGNVTGLLDWDHAHTMPRPMGYARFPSWITRDWSPQMYSWPGMSDIEDSPKDLEICRVLYTLELGKSLGWQGDWRFTQNSHMTEAVWVAAHHRRDRIEICRKLIEEALNIDTDTALGFLYDIGAGYYDDADWRELDVKLKRMVVLNPTSDIKGLTSNTI
ncbi:kinase-like protein [Annulohypoxylon bovei var. microspora]|nr:kinase-like protein [Annulohypoxylon bovei var. microspora]